MPKFPLIGPSYSSQSVNADCQQTMNLYPEVVESNMGNNNIVLYPSPGTKKFVELVPPTPPSTDVGLQNIRIPLSAAQINGAAAGTPIQLVAAQGPDLLIVPLFFTIEYNFVSHGYITSSGIFPFIGVGSNTAEVLQDWTYPVAYPSFQNVNTIQCAAASPSWQNNPPTQFVNKPLLWVDNSGGNDGLGDGTLVLHIQFFVLNVVTGQIVNGQPKRIFSNKVELSAAQLKNAFAFPIQLIAPPSASQMLVPLTMVIWHHFNTTPFVSNAFPEAGYGTTKTEVFNTPIFRSIDSNSFLFNVDSMEQEGAAFVTNLTVDPSAVIANPVTWANGGDISGDPGDSTATVYMQWLVIDTVTGELLEGGGDLFNAITEVSSLQIKNASTTSVSLSPVPAANLLHVPQYGVGQTHFVTTPYTSGNGGEPNPRVSPGNNSTDVVKLSLMSFFTSGGGPFTLWSAPSDQMLLARSEFYAPPNNDPANAIPPASVISQPISMASFTDIILSTGDDTATFNIQYVTLDTTTGALLTA